MILLNSLFTVHTCVSLSILQALAQDADGTMDMVLDVNAKNADAWRESDKVRKSAA